MKKVYKKAGYKVVFKSNPNLESILTKKNKVKLPKNSHPGVYNIPCGCGEVPPYVGQTKGKICSRVDQQREYVEKGQWARSGLASHAQTCDIGPLFDEARTIKPIQNRFDRCVREALEIQKNGAMPRLGGINRDDGQYVTTHFWMPFMKNLTNLEKKAKNTGSREITETPTSSEDVTSNVQNA